MFFYASEVMLNSFNLEIYEKKSFFFRIDDLQYIYENISYILKRLTFRVEKGKRKIKSFYLL